MPEETQLAPFAVEPTKEKPPARLRKVIKAHYKTLPKKVIDDILLYPDSFAEALLDMKFYPKQRVALRAMAPNKSFVSFLSCNDGGKTSRVVTALVLWHLFRFPKGKIRCTSGSARQLLDQMVPSIQRYRERFPSWKWLDSGPIDTTSSPIGTCRFFTTNEPGRAEGDHADAGKASWENPEVPLLFIVDECKSVPDWLRVAVEDRVKPTRIFLCSSPGFAEGWFFDTQSKLDYFPRYNRVTQCASECPHIDPEWVKGLRIKWAGQPDVAASVLGEGFMGMVANAIIDFRLLQDNINCPPANNMEFNVHAWCDFAWSGQDGDECVLALRRGNKITIEAAFAIEGLHPVCDRFVAEFKRLGLEPRMITGDDGGGGKLVVDELHKRGWKIHRMNAEATPKDPEHFANASAEIWYEAATHIANRKFILPDDPEFKSQAVNRKRKDANKGKLAIESKKEMRGRNVPSPDRADAIFGCMSRVGNYSSNGETTYIHAAGPAWASIGV